MSYGHGYLTLSFCWVDLHVSVCREDRCICTPPKTFGDRKIEVILARLVLKSVVTSKGVSEPLLCKVKGRRRRMLGQRKRCSAGDGQKSAACQISRPLYRMNEKQRLRRVFNARGVVLLAAGWWSTSSSRSFFICVGLNEESVVGNSSS